MPTKCPLNSLRSTAPSEALQAQWPDLQWGCAPKPATEPGCYIFRNIAGFEDIVEIGAFWLHFGIPRTSPNKVFVWQVLHFFREIEPKSLPEASRDLPELTLALLGLILPLLGVIWGLLGLVLDLLWASWDAPGVLPGRSREPLGSFLGLQKLPEALPEAPRTGA